MYFDADADLDHIEGETVCIVGFGNQGRSQALSLRDSGVDVIVGSQRDRSFDQAASDGFAVYPLAERSSSSSSLSTNCNCAPIDTVAQAAAPAVWRLHAGLSLIGE